MCTEVIAAVHLYKTSTARWPMEDSHQLLNYYFQEKKNMNRSFIEDFITIFAALLDRNHLGMVEKRAL